jgi:GTP-binding protein Era
MKSGFAAIIGRPSTGKSTLLNQLTGYKVSIISPVPQTTRNRIRGILNAEAGQLVFIDTPGFHLSERKLNLHLKKLILDTLEEVDLVVYLADSTRDPGSEEKILWQILSALAKPLVIAVNKIDHKKALLEPFLVKLHAALPDAPLVPVSALTGEGLPKLKEVLFAAAPEGEPLYPQDFYTDQSPEFRIAEIIREKAITRTHSELPHALYVELSDLEMRSDHLWVRGFLCVERESQKGILIGRGGEKIKAIRVEAETELNGIFPYAVKLDLRVKVRPKWRKNNGLLKKLIT